MAYIVCAICAPLPKFIPLNETDYLFTPTVVRCSERPNERPSVHGLVIEKIHAVGFNESMRLRYAYLNNMHEERFSIYHHRHSQALLIQEKAKEVWFSCY